MRLVDDFWSTASLIQRKKEVRYVGSDSIARRLQRSAAAGLATTTKHGPQPRRLVALSALYDCTTRTEAAKIGGVALQIIRD
jgi:hypothetical protein